MIEAPGGVWDTAIWDESTWDFETTSQAVSSGSLGIGRAVAVAMRGTAFTRFTLVGWDLSYTEGGFL